jgi:Zn-finger nucleic acid-binding protein
MKCPHCRKPLRTITYEGIHIESCDACEGEWLDSDELLHVVQAREALFNEQERNAIAAAPSVKGVKLADVDRDLVCPKCGGQTDAVNYGGNTGIIIDRCTGCQGIWLDGSELEKIQMLIEGWEHGLPEMLAKHGPRLRQIAEEQALKAHVRVSRFGFVNALINGILDRVV